jgi:Tfp pilus assembly protein PilP
VLIFLSGDPGKDPYPPPDAAKESALPVMGDVKHTPTIEILPEPERPVPTKNPFESPGAFSSSLRLTGIISGSTGSSAAIVVAGDRSYIVQVGDEIGKTGWSVTEINSWRSKKR